MDSAPRAVCLLVCWLTACILAALGHLMAGGSCGLTLVGYPQMLCCSSEALLII